jgi:tyrosyl-tRNA synthetase
MAQQTAVEWFWIHLEDDISKKYFDLFEQAKAMEKEQIIDAFKFGELPPPFVNLNAEEYYNETYGQIRPAPEDLQ